MTQYRPAALKPRWRVRASETRHFRLDIALCIPKHPVFDVDVHAATSLLSRANSCARSMR